MYIVSEGTAVVSNQGGQQLATLRRGDFFGDLALLNNKPRAANVSAASMSGSTTSGVVVSTKCLKLRRDDFMKLVAGDLDRRTAPMAGADTGAELVGLAKSEEMDRIIKASPLNVQLKVALSAAKLRSLELKCCELKVATLEAKKKGACVRTCLAAALLHRPA